MALTDPSATAEEAKIIQMLSHIPIFSGIGMHEQHLVARKCRIEEVKASQVIIEQGDIGDTLYLIIDGWVNISKRKSPTDPWRDIASLGPGEIVGEIAILRNLKRTARVTTKTNCTLLCINGHDFMEIYHHFPPRSRDNIQILVAKRLAELARYL